MEHDGVENVRHLLRSFVIEGLQREQLPRLTLDFDGSVQSTKGHAEGTAVGFNRNKIRYTSTSDHLKSRTPYPTTRRTDADNECESDCTVRSNAISRCRKESSMMKLIKSNNEGILSQK
jgi:hypothetical protein